MFTENLYEAETWYRRLKFDLLWEFAAEYCSEIILNVGYSLKSYDVTDLCDLIFTGRA